MSDVSLMRIADALEAIAVSLEKIANPVTAEKIEDKLKNVYYVNVSAATARVLTDGVPDQWRDGDEVKDFDGDIWVRKDAKWKSATYTWATWVDSDISSLFEGTGAKSEVIKLA